MSIAIHELCHEIRVLYRQNRQSKDIEAYLEERLRQLPGDEKIAALDQLSQQIALSGRDREVAAPQASQLLDFISQILGETLETGEFDEELLLEKFHNSMNDVFVSLNDLLRAMNTTIAPTSAFDETIRHVMKKQLHNEAPEKPLTEYIDQIRRAFFISYEAFQEAHLHVMNKVLGELQPEKSLRASGSGLKFSTLRKAQAFDNYTRLYETLEDWHNSGRGLHEFMRTFENKCTNPATHPEEKLF